MEEYTAVNDAPYVRFPVSAIAEASESKPRRSEATLVNIEDGHVLAAYANHVGTSDNARSHIAARILDGTGQPVGEEWVAVEPPRDGFNAMSPALRRLPDGRLGMLYSFRIGMGLATRHFISSTDEGRTWSEPVPVVKGGAYVTGCHDRFTVLRSGVLIAPLHCTDDWDKHYLHVRVARSQDMGKSWKLSDPMELPYVGGTGGIGTSWKGLFYESGCLEPGVVQRRDSSLLMTMRTAMGTQFCSESYDEGVSWTTPRSLEIVSPQAPANIVNVPDSSALLIIWNSDYNLNIPAGGDRKCLMCGLSFDGGRTWPHDHRRILVRDDSGSWDYPSVLYRGEELWMTVRHTKGARFLEGLTSTRLMRIPVSWIREFEVSELERSTAVVEK